ncbi:hypothetical protein DFH08DRAFT_816868 [Mycena albidolilacea]|uniref:Uncharacterized protein n=1 Tax=Mycena albidolilacea TaxID=1033008 RepID=A0AAD6ZJE1_9AGAR|nr:hypothetical protein DFH08DRAFT_816868 [Mycena albidolilacea]
MARGGARQPRTKLAVAGHSFAGKTLPRRLDQPRQSLAKRGRTCVQELPECNTDSDMVGLPVSMLEKWKGLGGTGRRKRREKEEGKEAVKWDVKTVPRSGGCTG